MPVDTATGSAGRTGGVKVCLFLQDLLQEVKQLKQKVEELEGEKGQYERKLRGTKVRCRP